jgi:hypothetical protein
MLLTMIPILLLARGGRDGGVWRGANARALGNREHETLSPGPVAGVFLANKIIITTRYWKRARPVVRRQLAPSLNPPLAR